MKKLLQHIIVYVMTATVFVATTGLSIHHLYCYCKGEAIASIFRPDEPCEKAEQASAKRCCGGTTCTKEEQPKGHNCSDCNSVYIKLDVKYVFNFSDINLSNFIAFPAQHFHPNIFVGQQETVPNWENDLPPPPGGKTLLPWIQSFLC